MLDAIHFEHVTKSYPNYLAVTQGLKNLVLNALSLNKAALSFKARPVFQDVSFTIRRGESVGVIGRNGAGKSTLLGLIAQVLSPDSGLIQVHGRVTPLLELGAGFHPELSGRENILLNAVLMGMSRKEAVANQNNIIEFAELREHIDRPVRTYSSGMKARLGFSVAAHLDPDILLVDEVLAVGDLSFQQKCQKVFTDLRAKGTTVILVSHSHAQVQDICDRCLWIENHQLRRDGPSKEVVAEYIKSF